MGQRVRMGQLGRYVRPRRARVGLSRWGGPAGVGVLVLACSGAVLATTVQWWPGPLSSERAAAAPTGAEAQPVHPIAAPASPPRSPSTAPTSAASTPTQEATPTGRLHAAALPASTGGGARVLRYALQVEGGLPMDPSEVAGIVGGVLEDDRGWQTRDDVDFVPVADGATAQADFVVILASPELTDALCAPLRTNGRLSCRRDRRVVLNAWRWDNGAASYRHDLAGYRTYLINHEVGHVLGHPHRGCPGLGQPAPVMMQQTISLGGCAPHPWP